MLENNFVSILTKTQEEMLEMLPEFIMENYPEYTLVVTDYAIGFKSPSKRVPCLVAHLDTINTKNSSDKAYKTSESYVDYSYSVGYGYSAKKYTEVEKTPEVEDIVVLEDVIMLHPMHKEGISCLGADDRVGVKSILDVLEAGHRPHILFTTHEESGCKGSRELITENTFDWLEDSSMFIQVDRGVHEGSWNEMVFYDYDPESNQAIFDELSKYYTLAQGSYTDVAVLGPHFSKPIVNLSASYINEHTTDEYIYLFAYENNIDGLIKFLSWEASQDTTEWAWAEKPKPKPIVRNVPAYYESTVQHYFGALRDLPNEANRTIKYYLSCIYAGKLDNCEQFVRNRAKSNNVDESELLYILQMAYESGWTAYTLVGLYELIEGTHDAEIGAKLGYYIATDTE